MIVLLTGRAGSGKDTAAAHLVQYGFERFALADNVRSMLLAVDPLVTVEGITGELSGWIALAGWDYLKRNVPEIRRLLQQLGGAVRSLHPDFWCRALLQQITAKHGPDALQTQNIVVSDVRFDNEVRFFREQAGVRNKPTVVRLTRSAVDNVAATDASEAGIAWHLVDALLCNHGTIADLHAQLSTLANNKFTNK